MARLLQLELFSPSIGSLYTAAFRALHAFLALNGRVFFDQPCWTDAEGDVLRTGDGDDGAVVALLTKENAWKFEPRKRGHEARWSELRQVFSAKSCHIPEFFGSLFDAIYGRRFRKGVPLRTILAEPDRKSVV